MPRAKSLKDLMRIRASNRAYLDSINANLGTALGLKKRTGQSISDEPAIIVFVPQKIHPKWIPSSQLIHKELKGPDGLTCPLDVVEGSQADIPVKVPRSESELAERLRGWDEKVWVGSQVSHWVDQSKGRYSTGTLGAFARRKSDGKLGFLTNMHVAVQPGQKLFHPVPWGTHIGTTQTVMEYVSDEAWYGVGMDEPQCQVRVDCAFVGLADGFALQDIDPRILGVGSGLDPQRNLAVSKLGRIKEISLDDMAIVGQKVLRVGRTTGLRRGVVVAFGYEYVDQADRTIYTDLLITGHDELTPFSTHGDSGSIIVTDDAELNPVGLLWGGWESELRTGKGQEKWTWGVCLAKVMELLNLDLVTQL